MYVRMSGVFCCACVQWNLSGTATCGPVILAFTEGWLHYRGRLHCFSAMLVLFGAREAGCFREVVALHSDHYRQVHCTEGEPA